jgi:hypothetical protein
MASGSIEWFFSIAVLNSSSGLLSDETYVR